MPLAALWLIAYNMVTFYRYILKVKRGKGMKYLLFFVSAAFLSGCSTGVYKVNNTSSGRTVFQTECSVGNIGLCQRRAASKCDTGYQTLKKYKGNRTVSTPIYRTRYRTYYRYNSPRSHSYRGRGDRGRYYYNHRPRRQAYTVRERYIVGYNHQQVAVQYLQFKCR